MAEDHIRDLIGRMEGGRHRGFRVSPGTAALIIHALRFYLFKHGWATVIPANFPRPYHPWPKPDPEKPLTIGQFKDKGHRSFYVVCCEPKCQRRWKLFTFDELGLPDDLVFTEIPRKRRFRCSTCGGHDVRVWPHTTIKTPGPAMTGEHVEFIYSVHNPNRVPPPPPKSAAMNPDRQGD